MTLTGNYLIYKELSYLVHNTGLTNYKKLYKLLKNKYPQVTHYMVKEWVRVHRNICIHTQHGGSRKAPAAMPIKMRKTNRLMRIGALLHRLYYTPDNPASFSSPEVLYYYAKKLKPLITREHVKNWLLSQDAYTMHRKIVHRFPRRKFISKGINYCWQIDLMELPQLQKENSGYRYGLIAIDTFSRKAYGVLMKKKNATTVCNAFREIIRKHKVKPSKIMSDSGLEFFNKIFKAFLNKNNIVIYRTEQHIKASMAERLIKSLKTKLFRYFTANNTLKYSHIFQDIITAYNNKIHSSLNNLSPNMVTKKNEAIVWKHLYGGYIKNDKAKFKFKIGDYVRISKYKNVFGKGYINNFTKDLFIVKEQIPTVPVTYNLMDTNKEDIKGIFYEPELSLVLVE